MNNQDQDLVFLHRAIEIALEAEKIGNLPVGSLITLNGEIISEGPSRVYQPKIDLTRHAEMEAIRALPKDYLNQVEDMTLYTTLEPCPMCLGGILLYGIRRVVIGSAYPPGGSLVLAEHLPPFFRTQFEQIEWAGPLLSEECDPLLDRLLEIESSKD